MRKRSKRLMAEATVLLLIVTVFVRAPSAQADTNPALADLGTELRQFRATIAALESDSFETRSKATKTLLNAGPAVMPPLADAVESGGLELALRALGIIEANYRHTDYRFQLAADDALSRLLSLEQRGLVSRVRSVVARNRLQWERVAEQRLREYGALFIVPKTGQTVSPVPVGRGQGRGRVGRKLPQIRIGMNWTGGEEGLRYLLRFRQSENRFVVYIIDGISDVSEEFLDRLELEYRPRSIARRGRAMLGIRPNHQRIVAGNIRRNPLAPPQPSDEKTPVPQAGCQIAEVEPGSAAQKGGIQINDVVTSFDGSPIADFEDLVGRIRSHNAGETVNVIVYRSGTLHTLQVNLGGWIDGAPSEAPRP